MFHERTISSLYEKYIQEQVECDLAGELEELATPAPLVQLIDKQVGIRWAIRGFPNTDFVNIE